MNVVLTGAVEVLVASLLALWFVGSVLNQFQFEWFEKIKNADHFALLPLWTFFAPNPGQTDYHLVYRDRRADGSITEWMELAITESRKFHSFVWNPEKRSKKVISDVVATLMESIRHVPPDEAGFAIMLSLPYLVLLNVVSNLAATPGATHRQFVIAETAGFKRTEDPRLVLKSDFHPLPDSTFDPLSPSENENVSS
jgi:hypothetical protein